MRFLRRLADALPRRVRRLPFALVAATLVVGSLLWLSLAGAALAQSAPGPAVDGHVDLTGLANGVLDTLTAVVLGVAGVIGTWVLKKLKLDQDATVRGYLMSAIDHAVHLAASKIAVSVDAASWLHPAVKDPLVESAAEYVLDAVPEAVARFGLTKTDVANLATARLAELVGVTQSPPVATPNVPAAAPPAPAPAPAAS